MVYVVNWYFKRYFPMRVRHYILLDRHSHNYSNKQWWSQEVDVGGDKLQYHNLIFFKYQNSKFHPTCDIVYIP